MILYGAGAWPHHGVAAAAAAASSSGPHGTSTAVRQRETVLHPAKGDIHYACEVELSPKSHEVIKAVVG